jgi:hypothetical protein
MKYRADLAETIGMIAGSIRALASGALVMLAMACSAAGQSNVRPPIGDYGSPPDAMIFYVAHGPADACGPGCADWIAAEGTIEWDTHKRLIAILDRQGGRKLPIVIHTWGKSGFNVAASMGRILRARGVDATVGATEVGACRDRPETECFALKRPGGPLDASIEPLASGCDVACLLMLAGAVHRRLPPDTKVILSGMTIFNRLAPNVSNEQRESLTSIFGDQLRLYLRQMGVDPELIDMVSRNSETRRVTELPPSEWVRLGIVTP